MRLTSELLRCLVVSLLVHRMKMLRRCGRTQSAQGRPEKVETHKHAGAKSTRAKQLPSPCAPLRLTQTEQQRLRQGSWQHPLSSALT